MNFCKNCILPDTRPNLILNNEGKCNACLNHEIKNKVNWKIREKQFVKLINKVKKTNKNNYDCLVPVSGGKDSTWQIIKCLEYKKLNLLCGYMENNIEQKLAKKI